MPADDRPESILVHRYVSGGTVHMPYLLVRLKVADFARWKRVFDSHAEAQRQAGMRVERVLRNLDDPNEVVTWFAVTDLAKAQGL
jgi:hypothetical protein